MGTMPVAAFATTAAGGAECKDNGYVVCHQLFGHRREAVVLPFSPSVFDDYVFAIRISSLFQAPLERDDLVSYLFRGRRTKYANLW